MNKTFATERKCTAALGQLWAFALESLLIKTGLNTVKSLSFVFSVIVCFDYASLGLVKAV